MTTTAQRLTNLESRAYQTDNRLERIENTLDEMNVKIDQHGVMLKEHNVMLKQHGVALSSTMQDLRDLRIEVNGIATMTTAIASHFGINIPSQRSNSDEEAGRQTVLTGQQ